MARTKSRRTDAVTWSLELKPVPPRLPHTPPCMIRRPLEGTVSKSKIKSQLLPLHNQTPAAQT